MGFVGALTGGLLPILVVVGIVAGIIALVRRGRGDDEDEPEPGIGTLRRLFYYGLAFVALMVAASGVLLLLTGLAGGLSGAHVLAGGEAQLAFGIALAVVGTPIWAVQWRFAQRATRQYQAETQAVSRKLYLYVVMGVAAALGASGLVSLIQWALGAEEFSGTLVAFPLVWGGIWAFHFRTATLEGERTGDGRAVRRLYLYVTSGYGLAMLAVSVGMALHQVLGAAYDALADTGPALVRGRALWGDTARNAVAVGAVGGAWWWWHWCRGARGDAESLLRQVYLYLFAVLGAAIAVVSSLSAVLYLVLQWLIGSPDVTSAAVHFSFLPVALAVAFAAGGVWLYHWAVVREEAEAAIGGAGAAGRVYRYLVAAIGLVTLSGGFVILFATMLGMVVPQARAALVGADWWRNPMSLAITLVAVGAPTWGIFWLRAQRDALAGGVEKRAALSRRTFIYAVLGVAVLFALGNLSALLFIVFMAILEGDLSLEALRGGKWAVGMLLMVGVVSYYYWRVLKEDRAAAPPPDAPTPALAARKSVVVLVSQADLLVVRELERRLGYSVRVWRRLDADPEAQPMAAEDVAGIERLVAEAAGDWVLLTFDEAGVRAVAFREG